MNVTYCGRLETSESPKCWKRCVCRCQTGVMIAVISPDTIRRVFTKRPNVCTVIHLIVKPLALDLGLNIYLFVSVLLRPVPHVTGPPRRDKQIWGLGWLCSGFLGECWEFSVWVHGAGRIVQGLQKSHRVCRNENVQKIGSGYFTEFQIQPLPQILKVSKSLFWT